jgi:aryl-alcohol dehydrogenase-like predicted oxidoreductase
MKYTTLGSTGIEVSRLCFGTMSFGGDADEEMAGLMFNRCRDAGINFFDCANIYSQGKAEEILGRLIKPCRNELVITSKVCCPVGPGKNERGLSRRHIMMQVEASLSRLGTDRLDVYFCHHRDPKTNVEETLAAMDDLIRQGKVLYLGISNWAAWQIAQAVGMAQLKNIARVAVIQPMYSLVKRTAEIEILPMAGAMGIGVIPYSPLGGGLLTGKYSQSLQDAPGRLANNKMYAQRYQQETYLQIAQRFAEYARLLGLHPATLAVAWVKASPSVTAPIIGARNVDQLEASLAAGDYEMSPGQWKEISDLTPAIPLATDRDEERDKPFGS